MSEQQRVLELPALVGSGYGEFWNFRGRYRVVKGGRASKKSKTTALWYIYHMMAMPEANLLVVRKTGRSLKNSCFTELKWAVERLGVQQLWACKAGDPLEMTYTPTGQKILFRGLDDPMKVTSIAAETGSLCWMWIEEAYEIMRERDFDMLDESIRGKSGVFKQITLTFNPWNERHWLKKRFFDPEPDEDILAMTTDYRKNEWLDEADRRLFEQMRRNNPRRYQVAGLGNWGVAEGLIYDNWREYEMTKPELQTAQAICGMDFGYTNDPTAIFIGFADLQGGKIYVWDEIYEKGLTNRDIWSAVLEKGYGKELFIADSAEPKSIDELKGYGMRVRGARKGKDSILSGIQWIQNFEILIHPRCVNFLREISGYAWESDRFGRGKNVPVDEDNHLMDAMRYGVERARREKGWMY